MSSLINKPPHGNTSLVKRVLFCLSLLLLFTKNSPAISKSNLGVSFCDFSAVVSEYQVKLQWSTLQEHNNKLFMVERSNNAIDFVLIDTLSGTGTSNQRNNYCLYDKNPPVGVCYYRITQIDHNNFSSKSNIISIEYVQKPMLCEGINKAQVYPVPFDKLFSIDLNCLKDTKIAIEIRGETGKMVFSAEKNCFQGPNSFTYDEFSRFQTGMYFVLISDQMGCDLHFSLVKRND